MFTLFFSSPLFSQHTTYLTGNFEYAERQWYRNERSRAEQFIFTVDFARLYAVAGIELGPRIIVDVTSNNRFFPTFGSGSVFLVGQKSFATSIDPSLEILLRTDLGFTLQEDSYPLLVGSSMAAVLNGPSVAANFGIQKSLDNRLVLFSLIGFRVMPIADLYEGVYVNNRTRGLEFSVGFGWRSK